MDSLDFMRVATGASGGGGDGGGTETVDFYTRFDASVACGHGTGADYLHLSHEGLLLEYEEALTRKVSQPASTFMKRTATTSRSATSATVNGTTSTSAEGLSRSASTASTREARPDKFYNLSSHFIWIGDRTRQPDGAHVEYFRGIQNPIGIKVGPTMQGDELVRLLDGKFCLVPETEHGH